MSDNDMAARVLLEESARLRLERDSLAAQLAMAVEGLKELSSATTEFVHGASRWSVSNARILTANGEAARILSSLERGNENG